MNVAHIDVEHLVRAGMTPQRITELGGRIEGETATFEDGPGYDEAMKVLGRVRPPVAAATTPDDLMAKVGPPLWGNLHRWALSADLTQATAWLDGFARTVPCGECARHWLEITRRTPPDLKNADSLFAWTVERHNEVNLRLGKPVLDVAAARATWSKPLPAPPNTAMATAGVGVLERRARRAGAMTAAIGMAAPVILSRPPCQTSADGRRILRLRCTGGLGDMTALSGAVRDLHLAYPGRFHVEIRHWTAAMWRGLNAMETSATFAQPIRNPPPGPGEHSVNVPVSMYGDGSIHLQELHARQLRKIAGVDFPTTRLGGHLQLSDAEKAWVPPWPLDLPVCILNFGSKQDFTVKQPDPRGTPQIIRHFEGRIRFVQVGGRHHVHPPIEGAIDFLRKPDDPESVWTDFRWTMLAMYRAKLVISPVSWPMHLAAALEVPPGSPLRRCVTLAGGREQLSLFQYPGHSILHTLGKLPCCQKGPCWLMKVRSECLAPVQVKGLADGVALCMQMASSPNNVIPVLERILQELSA